jgi:hypothetical protein
MTEQGLVGILRMGEKRIEEGFEHESKRECD